MYYRKNTSESFNLNVKSQRRKNQSEYKYLSKRDLIRDFQSIQNFLTLVII